MTKLFEQAIESIRRLPPAAQDDIARIVLQLARIDDLPPLPMSAEDEASFDESLAEAERGEFVDEEAVRTLWAKHGL